MIRQSIVFSYPFSSTIIRDLINIRSSDRLKNIFRELNALENIDKNWTIRDFFENSYKQLLKNYRNEYVFKNAIAQKILIGKHSLKSSTLFTELRVGNSKADVVIFNGTSYVYEIKTDLDKLDRLKGQIENYKKVFEFVNVVSVESKVDEIHSLLDDDIGVIILSDRYTLKIIRKAKSMIKKGCIDKGEMFTLLRKQEYIDIIDKYYGVIPNVPNTKIYNECKKLFTALPINIAQKELLNALKSRKNHTDLIETIKQFPDSLKVAVLEANLNKKEQNEFLDFLNQKISTIL